MDAHYRHTQVGWTIIVLVVGVAVLDLTILTVSASQSVLALALSGALAAVLAVLLVVFGTLTVEVDDRELRLWFGTGAVRRRVALAEVAAAATVRNPLWSGWGVRVIPGGRLYNVGGWDAVELRLESGRVVRVGTDEPDALLAAVSSVIARGEV